MDYNMVKSDMPPTLQESLRSEFPIEDNLSGQEVEEILGRQVDYVDIAHIHDNCCAHRARFQNKEQGVDIKLIRKSGHLCGLCSSHYKFYQHDKEIAHADRGCCGCCCGKAWNLELINGVSLKSEQKKIGEVTQHKGMGLMPANTKSYQKNYSIQSKHEGHYYCCLKCTTLCACCALTKRKKCCPMECMTEGGMCRLCCCLCVNWCCPLKKPKGCCPWECMYGDGCCSVCCYCCVSMCCPVSLSGAHNYIIKRTNIPFCCCSSNFHLEFDPNMTSMDKFTCILQTSMMR